MRQARRGDSAPWKLRAGALCLAAAAACAMPRMAAALDGGTLQVTPRNGWKAFEVISNGNNPVDAFSWAMPNTFDGLGAFKVNDTTLRLQINHENADATISEVNLNLANFKTAIGNMIASSNTGGVSFVASAQQAYGRWSANGGASFTATADVSTTAFARFCSGQLHPANTFGLNRGFVDNIYMTGEEVATTGRLFALDLTNRDFYQVSGVAGTNPAGGIGGMPFDSYENACLIDTGETNHVALLLSPDGGTQQMKLYVGVKGKDNTGAASTGFLARNGLQFGSYYYLNDTLPTSGTSTDCFFDTTSAGALTSAKFEDVDTNPNNPTKVVQGVQETGLFSYSFNLDFSSGSFNPITSSASITKLQNQNDNQDGLFGDADNVDWTLATALGANTFADGLIFVNEDSDTGGGETWMMRPDGSGLTLIADTIPSSGATETSGVLDISTLVGYKPGSILLTSNQGTTGSLTVLINPLAALAPVPEPSTLVMAMAGLGLLGMRTRRRRAR